MTGPVGSGTIVEVMRLLVGTVVAALLVTLGAAAPASAKPDPRWRFYTSDTSHYTSPWFGGARRIMVPFGCTRAPYYDPDPRCRHGRGFHHGIDIALPCGTPIYASARGKVLNGAGFLASIQGVRIRSGRVDILIGHARRVYVSPGDVVRPGALLARASDSGAPDGCHLHFEVRPHGGGYTTAVAPRSYLRLTRTGR